MSILLTHLIAKEFRRMLDENLMVAETVNALGEDKSPEGRALLKQYAAVLREEADHWRKVNFKRLEVRGPIQ